MTDLNASAPYQALCTEFYELDKPTAPEDALNYYMRQVSEAKGPILEPMCGTGRFLIPLLEKGFQVTGFDNSKHMLDVCRDKCRDKNLSCELVEAAFESFQPTTPYHLIFIPSGSFGLITNPDQIQQTLKTIYDWLDVGGKFIIEIETPKSASDSNGEWKCHWINKPDDSLLVLSTASRYHAETCIQTVLCRYELWKNHGITHTEVEEFCQRLYEISEIENLLDMQGFKIVNRLVPYSEKKPDADAETVLLECIKP